MKDRDFYYRYHNDIVSRYLSANSEDIAGGDETRGGSRAIPPFRLFLALCCPLVVALFAYNFKLKIEKKILISVFRAAVQLYLAGYVLLSFIFSMKSPILVMCYLIMMTGIAALESTARQVRTYDGHFYDSFVAIIISGAVAGIICCVLILDPIPWWNPQIVIPTVGMLIGNAISGPAVAVDRFLATVTEQKHELETRLSFGSTGFEAAIPQIRAAILAALLPNLNQMAVVGIVSIPGMMTGQLLGGASPLVAAEYQMMILWLICSTSALSTFLALSYAFQNAAMDKQYHRLTYHRITKKSSGKKDFDSVVLGCLIELIQRAKRAIVLTWEYSLSRARGIPVGASSSAATEYSNLPNSDGASSSSHGGFQGLSVSPLGHNLENSNNYDEDDLEASMRESRRYKSSISIVHNHGTQYGMSSKFSPTNDILFEARNINIVSGDLPLFSDDGLTISLQYGERLSVEGLSGLGKTRLLRAIAQLDPLKKGVINLFDNTQPNQLIPAADEVGGAANARNSLNIHGSESVAAENQSINSWQRRSWNAFFDIPLALNWAELQKPCKVLWYGNSSPGPEEVLANPLVVSAPPGGRSQHTSPRSWLQKTRDAIAGALMPYSRLTNNALMPSYRRRCIYVPEALPPMSGSPKTFIQEVLEFTSRKSDATTPRILSELTERLAAMEISLGLNEGKMNQDWTMLSGGERQRAAIGCALIAASAFSQPSHCSGATFFNSADSPDQASFPPVVLLLDEPTAACDPSSCKLVEQAIVAAGVAVIVITHDERQAIRLCHKRLMMKSL